MTAGFFISCCPVPTSIIEYDSFLCLTCTALRALLDAMSVRSTVQDAKYYGSCWKLSTMARHRETS